MAKSESTFKALITGKERLLVRLVGPITEVADFAPVQFSRQKPIEIDLGEVVSINSVGIREFSAWSNGLQNPVIEFSHCPKFFIDQVNMIKGLIPMQSKFLSFYVPYYDSSTGAEKRVLFRRGLEFDVTNGDVQLMFPEVKDDSGEVMELDVIPDRYFAFLSKYI